MTAFLEQYYSEKDLQKFYTQYYPSLVGTPMSKVVGPNKAPAGIEASLDVEYMTTLGAGEDYDDDQQMILIDDSDDDDNGDVIKMMMLIMVIKMKMMMIVR